MNKMETENYNSVGMMSSLLQQRQYSTATMDLK